MWKRRSKQNQGTLVGQVVRVIRREDVASNSAIREFGQLEVGRAFQVIWTVPGPVPDPPATTVFTKIPVMSSDRGQDCNAIYRSSDPQNHFATFVQDDQKCLIVDQKYAIGVRR
jgi:hypothetical protein